MIYEETKVYKASGASVLLSIPTRTTSGPNVLGRCVFEFVYERLLFPLLQQYKRRLLTSCLVSVKQRHILPGSHFLCANREPRTSTGLSYPESVARVASVDH